MGLGGLQAWGPQAAPVEGCFCAVDLALPWTRPSLDVIQVHPRLGLQKEPRGWSACARQEVQALKHAVLEKGKLLLVPGQAEHAWEACNGGTRAPGVERAPPGSACLNVCIAPWVILLPGGPGATGDPRRLGDLGRCLVPDG